jgi:osmotically inducible lipoprotein OsmB
LCTQAHRPVAAGIQQCSFIRAGDLCDARFDFLTEWRIFMNFTQRISAAALLLAALGLGGCAGMTQQEKGTATGAVIGGVAGNIVGGGLLGTAAGAAVGGVIGHEVTK